MKYLLLLLLKCSFFTCTQAQTTHNTSTKKYGQAFSADKVIPVTTLKNILSRQDSAAVKVVGQVQSVCQVKGCWLDIKLADNSVMKVRFKDYAFFVPKNLTGKTVVLNGMAYNKTISVSEQRHYAQDAGQPAAVIQAITQPKQSVTFTASGVQVK